VKKRSADFTKNPMIGTKSIIVHLRDAYDILFKTFTMKSAMSIFRNLLLTIFLAAATTMASAENIYRPDTAGHDLYQMIERFLPEDMTAVIMLQEDPGRLMLDADEAKLASAGFSQQTYDYFLAQIKNERAHNDGRLAYANTGPGIPGNGRGRIRLCAIVVVDSTENHPDELLSHEVFHCKNSQIRDTEEYVKIVLPVWREVRSELSWADFTHLLDEAMVAGLQVAYAAKEDKTEPPFYVEKFTLMSNQVGNSIGSRTAKNLIELCMQKYVCPTDSMGMLRAIIGHLEIQEDLIADMKDLRGAD
jgi:hypothetical protein